MSGTTTNIASHLPAMAKTQPDRDALVAPLRSGGKLTWQRMSFAELDAKSSEYAAGLASIGITRGVRTVLMTPPDLDFFPLVFGLFKVGAVLVLIDPGIARKALLACLAEVEPEAFIGIPKAHLARLLFPHPFRHVRSLVTVGKRWFWGGHSLREIAARGAASGSAKDFAMVDPAPNETAAILFTSGSTGVPKGVVYTHAMFDAQVRSIRATYQIEPGEIDLPTFPMFALFDPALGMTAVLPEMDFRFPAQADPARISEALQTHKCTNMFASPALLDSLGRHGAEHGLHFPDLRRVLSAGAPVRTDILERMSALVPKDSQVFTPFGATESLPVTSIGSHEVLGDTGKGTAEGRGICVGKPVEGSVVRIIAISDDPIATWSDAQIVPTGTIGEITVRGPVVTHEYYARPEGTALAKIREGDAIVHRMGDVGSFDERGRLWMCGRKGHRVVTSEGTLFTVPIEEIMNAHPGVKRTALVGIGDRGSQHAVLLIERDAASTRVGSDADLLAEMRALAKKHPVTERLDDLRIYPKPFPVDTRHNAKIEREKLAIWAAQP